MVLRVGGGRILSNATILKLPGRHVLVYVRAGEDVGWRLSQIEGALTRNRRPIHRLRGDFTQLKENINLVVTFGGDGTFLQAASLFPHEAPTFLPISGGTLGFMLPWGLRQCRPLLPAIAMGEVHGTLLKRMRLEVSIPGQLTMTALNEVNIYRGASPSLTRLECSIGNELLTHAIADGLLLSTPTGSTAYSLSAGGPIMHPSVMGMLLTPICPRSLSFRPVILPTQTTIRVRVSEESRACAQMSIDGQAPVELPRGSQVIIKESPFPLPVLSPIDATQEWIHSISKLSGRLAIIFPGQGSQSVGMLNGPLASRMAERADAILGYSLSDLITSGPADTLAQTEHTQPAMVLASLCEWAHLREKYPQLTKHDHVFAGNSVGEYSAMAAAGWISFDVAIKLAALRGKVMAKAKGRGVMSVVNTRMKADLFQLVQLVQTMMDPELVGIAAINSSSQFILSGDLEQILKIEDKLKENPDVLKVQRLQGVSCAFHSPFMREVAEEFKVEAKVLLEQIKPDPAIPVISNYTAMEHVDGLISCNLVRQIVGTVRWDESIRRMHQLACEAILPIGPGSVLRNLLKRDPTVKLPILDFS